MGAKVESAEGSARAAVIGATPFDGLPAIGRREQQARLHSTRACGEVRASSVA
jgi:hypothetical protein